MEDTDSKDTNTSTAPVPGMVMDVAPPKSIAITDGEITTNEVTEAPVEAAVEAPTETPPVTEEPKLEPSFEAPIAPPEPTTEGSSDQPPAEKNPLAIEQPHKKSGAPVAAIVVAIIIALALAGITVYAYMKTKNDKTSTTNKSAPVAAKVTTADVDQVSKDVDSSLGKTDDSKDFSSTDLTDQTLGL